MVHKLHSRVEHMVVAAAAAAVVVVVDMGIIVPAPRKHLNKRDILRFVESEII